MLGILDNTLQRKWAENCDYDDTLRTNSTERIETWEKNILTLVFLFCLSDHAVIPSKICNKVSQVMIVIDKSW